MAVTHCHHRNTNAAGGGHNTHPFDPQSDSMTVGNRSVTAPETPLGLLLATLPSLPRSLVARLATCLIDRLDEMDGDSDDEPEEDRCDAGDDEMAAGVSPAYRAWSSPLARDYDDAEPQYSSAFDRDQSPRLTARYEAPKRRRKQSQIEITNVAPLIPIGRMTHRGDWHLDTATP